MFHPSPEIEIVPLQKKLCGIDLITYLISSFDIIILFQLDIMLQITLLQRRDLFYSLRMDSELKAYMVTQREHHFLKR